MKFPLAICLLTALLALTPIGAVYAASPAETLEAGIYQEETKGDLTEAIKTYRKVIADAEKSQELAAQAQFRLAHCLLKLGKKAEATAAFETLIEKYPQQKELVAKARKMTPAGVALQLAMWKPGEQLTLTMKLPNGAPIGLVGTYVEAGKVDGKPVWKMVVRRHVAGGLNAGLSRVTVDQATNLPLSSDWSHTLLGDAKTKWSPTKLVITTIKDDKPVEKTVETNSVAYSNDQWFYGFRQLPLEKGYKVTLPIRVAFSGGSAVGLEMTVAGKEKVETPAGTFECFKLDTNIAQTFWVTDTPERYIARFDAGGVSALLTSIGDGNEEKLSNDSVGLTLVKPADWFHYASKHDNPANRGGFRLAARDSIQSMVVDVRQKKLLAKEEQQSVKAWLDAHATEIKDQFQGAKIVDGSRRKATVAGEAGETLTIAYASGNMQVLADIFVAFKGDKAIEIVLSGKKAAVENGRAAAAKVISSVTVK